MRENGGVAYLQCYCSGLKKGVRKGSLAKRSEKQNNGVITRSCIHCCVKVGLCGKQYLYSIPLTRRKYTDSHLINTTFGYIYIRLAYIKVFVL